MRRFILLMILFASGCMTASEKECKDSPETVLIKDTVTVVRTDTVFVTVPVEVVRLSTPFDNEELKGAWVAEYTGRFALSSTASEFVLTLAFTKPRDAIDSTSSLLRFTASRFQVGYASSPTTFEGKVKSLENGVAEVEWNFSHKCSWLLRFDGSDLMIQEIGDGFFLNPTAITFRR